MTYHVTFTRNPDHPDARIFTLHSKTGTSETLRAADKTVHKPNFKRAATVRLTTAEAMVTEWKSKLANPKSTAPVLLFESVYEASAELIAYPTAGVIFDPSLGFARL